ncbi:hypothetical protein [Nonomuraea lactucae]|uniref:hypothetical protein n=1 Tax=Nonomuraea lactucae TaxID=2249762 RepID=UPI0013B44D95|nr:hypothetical protein [Nonomuraea lactucae]
MISAIDPVAAIDTGDLAFGVARLALAVAGLLWVVYLVSVVVLMFCARWVRR